MNLNERITKVLEVTGMPVEPDEYAGESDKYIIFTLDDETPEAYADNRPTADTAYMQVQLITPKDFNYFPLKKQIRNLLEGADFIVTSIRSFLGDVYVGTEKTRQTVFNVKYTEGRKEED